jgi:protein-L-isoaspartate(D-aspartate) O-methyltransferase
MVETQLRPRGIDDPRVLDAMLAVPREHFLPAEVAHLAYRDGAVPLGGGQTMSQPFMVAVMTQTLDPGPGDRVLEIGTGSGYQAAILARIAAEVYSVERLPELADSAQRHLDELGVTNVVVRTGDGTLGWPVAAPFDRVLVTAAAPEIPPALAAQLSTKGGRLVAPVGGRRLQRLTILERTGDTYRRADSTECRFVPLLGVAGWALSGSGEASP